MPATYPQTYFPILLQVAIACAVAGGMLAGSFFLGKRIRNPVKEQPYECGIVPTGSARERFSVKFYLVGMVFILFDIEVVFLYPWAVVYRELRLFAFVEMAVFLGMVLCGFFYIWKQGALDWSPRGSQEE